MLPHIIDEKYKMSRKKKQIERIFDDIAGVLMITDPVNNQFSHFSLDSLRHDDTILSQVIVISL